MPVVLSQTDLRTALETLNNINSDEVLRIQMVQLIKNSLGCIITDCAFIVDAFPKFDIIISRPKDPNAMSATVIIMTLLRSRCQTCSEGYPAHWFLTYYILGEDKNIALFKEMMSDNSVVDWTNNTEKAVFIYGMAEVQAKLFNEIAEDNGWRAGSDGLKAKAFSVTKDDVCDALLSLPPMEGITCSKLCSHEASLVLNRWRHSHSDVPNILEGIRFSIKHLPNICLRDKEDKVVAHMLTSFTGEILMLNVLESHRRRGLGTAAQLLLCEKVFERDQQPFWIVMADNEQSMRMNRKLKSKLLDNGETLYGFRYVK